MAGVPQGLVSRVTLVTWCSLLQYAADTMLLSRHIDFRHDIDMLQNDTVCVINWFSDTLMDINFSKRK